MTTSTAVRVCRGAEQARPAGPGPYCRCGCTDRPGSPCARCGHRPNLNRQGKSPLARELCPRCWHTAKVRDELADWPRRTRSRDDVLDEWVMLRAEGHTRGQAAERLGMTQRAFDAALYRARRAGDPRALPPLARAEGASV